MKICTRIKDSIVNIVLGAGRGRKYAAFLFAAAGLFLFFYSAHVTQFYHDSSGYWQLSCYFGGDALLTLFPTSLQLDERTEILFSLRGYTYPLFLYLFRGGPLDSLTLYWMSLSVFYSYAFTWALPDIFEALSGRKFNPLQRVLPLLLLVLLWHGLFIYPLTDLFSFALAVCVLKIAVYLKENKELRTVYVFSLYLAAGILMYALYNVRSAWMYSCAVAIIIFALAGRDRKAWIQAAASVALLAGITVASMPQAVINYHYYQEASPKNPLSLRPEYSNQIRLYQGFIYPRIEGYLPTSQIRVTDPVSLAIAEKENISAVGNMSFLQLFKLLLKYPLEVAGIYTTHVINSADVRYGEVYISESGIAVSWAKTLKILLMHSLWFMGIAGASVLLKGENPGSNKKELQCDRNGEIPIIIGFISKYGLTTLYFLLPSLVALAVHVEPRYSLSMHIMMFVFLAMLCPYKRVFSAWKARPVSTAALWLLSLGICCAVWNWTFGSSGTIDIMLK